ncbi:hypothetical protein BDQ94DRAFT_155921, partial [Aspergillus welwitschiae]
MVKRRGKRSKNSPSRHGQVKLVYRCLWVRECATGICWGVDPFRGRKFTQASTSLHRPLVRPSGRSLLPWARNICWGSGRTEFSPFREVVSGVQLDARLGNPNAHRTNIFALRFRPLGLGRKARTIGFYIC